MTTALHPSFGPVPPAEFLRASQAPAGEATNILRKFAPTFGFKATMPNQTYKVTVARVWTINQSASVTIEAGSAEEAEKLAEAMRESDFEWRDDSTDTDDFHAENAEAV